VKSLSQRTRTIIFAGIALLALVLLATTLNALQLDPGENVPLYQLAPQVVDAGAPNDLERIMLAVMRVLVILMWIAVPFGVIMLIISKEARKRFMRDLMTFLPLLVIIYLISRRRPNEGAAEEINPGIFNLGPIEEMAGDPNAALPTYQAPAEWVTGLVTILLAVAIAVALALIGWAIYRRSRMRDAPLQRIEQEAQSAIDAIEAGGDLSEVIMRCYFQMIEALKQYRNIQRDRDMTPHEFERHLVVRGMPREPVSQLTRLFEQVRYGGIRPGRTDERAAIASLTAIVSACQRGRGE